MNDLEHQLRTTLTEIAAHDTPTPDLAERLITSATRGDATVIPLRRSHSRLLRPMLAAAVVVLVAAGVLIGTRFVSDGPSVTPPVAPVTTSVPVSATEPAPKPPSWFTANGNTFVPGPPSWVTSTAPRATGLPPEFVPQDVQFLDGSTGFMVGTGTCSGREGDCGGLFRTQDGGATWTALTGLDAAAGGSAAKVLCLPGSPEIEQCKSGVNFSDLDSGVVWSDGVVFVTSDAGVTWRALGGLTGRHVVTAAQIGTTVLALTWSENETQPPYRIHVSSSRSPFVAASGSTDLSAVRSLAAVGSRWYVDAPADGSDRMLSTADGRQWRTEPNSPCSSSPTGRPDGTLFVSCSDTTGMSPSWATLAPGGTAWSTFGGVRVSFAGSSYDAGVVGYLDPQHYAMGATIEVYGTAEPYLWAVTQDGGASWTTTASKQPFPEALQDLGGGVLVGSLLVQGYLVTSTDLGLTWTARAVR